MVRPGWLTLLLGDRGERVAVRHLKRLGYKILERNARNRIGEIDVIALDGDTIVYAEVKTRSSLDKGHPTEAVTQAKQKQIVRTALAWAKKRGLLEHRSRYDIVSIIWNDGTPVIEHYKHAFEAPE